MNARRRLWTEYDAVTQLTTGRELREPAMQELLAQHPGVEVDESGESARVTLPDGTFYVHHWNLYG